MTTLKPMENVHVMNDSLSSTFPSYLIYLVIQLLLFYQPLISTQWKNNFFLDWGLHLIKAAVQTHLWLFLHGTTLITRKIANVKK